MDVFDNTLSDAMWHLYSFDCKNFNIPDYDLKGYMDRDACAYSLKVTVKDE